MILSAAVFFGILVLVLWKRKYRREIYIHYRERIHTIPAFFCCGLFLSGVLGKIRPASPEELEIREILLLSQQEEETNQAKRFSWMLLFGLIAALLSFLLFLHQGGRTQVRAVKRPEFGETRQVDLVAEGENGSFPVSFSLSGREPAEDEVDAVFDRIYADLQKEILQDNPDFFSVRTNLRFPKETSEGVRVVIQSSRPEILSDNGILLKKEIPKEGESVFLTVLLSYGNYRKEYSREVRIIPWETPRQTEKELLQALIEENDQVSKEQEIYRLPEEFNGEPIRFYPVKISPYLVLAAAAAFSLWLFVFPLERRKEKLKRRRAALEETYAGFVLRLAILLRSGLSTRSAWERILRDYETSGVAGKKGTALSEEMKLAVRNMEHGMPEDQAYLKFGERCGLSSYRRLGNFLAGNLRYGLSGAQEVLNMEVEKALEEKKNTALRKGEEAGTKLLFPMFLLLIVVLVMIVVPAFMMLY